MRRKIKAGQTSICIPVAVTDTSSSTGALLSGLAYNTASLTAKYRRQGQATATTITLAAGTVGTWSSGGFVADPLQSGVYELGLPDAAVAAGARWVEIALQGAANMKPVLIEIELDAIDYQDAAALGLTSLSAIFAKLPLSGLLAGQSDIDAINQSASRRLVVAVVGQMERPESGSSTYTVELRTWDGDGAATNADTTPTVAPVGIVSGSLAANLSAVSNPATGVYRATYTVPAAHAIEQVRFDASATIGGSTFTLSAYSQVADFVAATFTTTDRTDLQAAKAAALAAQVRVETGVPNAAPGASGGVVRVQDLPDVPTAEETAAAVQAGTSLADIATMVTGDGTGGAKWTGASLIEAPTQPVLHEGIYTIFTEDAGADGVIKSFVGDTRRIVFQIRDKNRTIVPLAGTVTAVLTDTSTDESGDDLDVSADSIAANVGSVDVETPTAGKFRLTVRMVSGGLTTTAGPITVLVTAR